MAIDILDEGTLAEQRLLARSLGALIAAEPFRSPVERARAVHGATLALAMFGDYLPEAAGDRLKELRARSIAMALNEDAPAITESDRVWLIGAIRRVLGKAGVTAPAAERLH
ncbi:MAG TPA: hypothetical protein VJT14_00055 [Candidatus Dormibacteraeota bacterium]|nr:hypothetical protein [Candidatus Dormibacteraeota bacterium]